MYGLGAPLIHAAHGHWDKAGLSLGMRAFPVVALTSLLTSPENDVAPALFVGSFFTVVALDSALLANEQVEAEEPRLTLAPKYDPHARAGALVVNGAF
jgi:hypothetical protein